MMVQPEAGDCFQRAVPIIYGSGCNRFQVRTKRRRRRRIAAGHFVIMHTNAYAISVGEQMTKCLHLGTYKYESSLTD